MKRILIEEVEAVEKALNEYFDSRIKEVERYGQTHAAFYNNIREYMTRGGKRLRPALITVGYKAVKEVVELERLYRAALSLEILHNGSLLHDDLIDHDETRRGGPTFHVIYRDWLKANFDTDQSKADDFGMTMAILGGDALINTGAQMLTSSELPPKIGMKVLEYYQYGFQNLVDGVLLEFAMVRDPDTTPDMYLNMVYMKTAVLFERALMMGAVMANATESQLEALGEFGRKAGQAFQVQDDILGSFGEEAETGKPTDGDIREGKKTMLVVQAFELGTDDQKRQLKELLGKDGMSVAEVEQVRTIFKESGALQVSKNIMDELLAGAHSSLETAKPPLSSKYKEFLVELSNFLAKRSY
ncbi:MAG: polyprenyl synthetase family protein [Candidatus Thorarchaeota archaeon]|nr:MAG: polyprenyl synthetase family protein [Candidatus Thorarchaeota archaeon]